MLAASVCLLLGGAGLATAGTLHLLSLERSFARTDFVFGVSARSTQVWIRELAEDTSLDDAQLTSRLAERLSNLTIEQRREITLAMAEGPFWATAIPDFLQRGRWLSLANDAVLKAVARAPMQGELWYLAARLRVMTSGCDAACERYLALSQTYTPKEMKFAAARLEVAARQGSALSPALREVAQRDYQFVLEAFPDLADDLSRALAAGGVTQ